MGVNGGAVNMKCKESRRAVGLDQCGTRMHILCYLPFCVLSGCLHMLSIQDPRCVTPRIRRDAFYFDKCKPLRF